MTPGDLETLARDAAALALGRPPSDAEIIRVLAVWLADLDGNVSSGFMRRAPLRPVRPPKKPAPEVQ